MARGSKQTKLDEVAEQVETQEFTEQKLDAIGAAVGPGPDLGNLGPQDEEGPAKPEPAPEPPKVRTIFLYRVKRACQFANRFYDPNDREQANGVKIDVAKQGIPPHHFLPLDGGPVGARPKNSIFPAEEKQARRPSRKTPTTFSQMSAQHGKPLGPEDPEKGPETPTTM